MVNQALHNNSGYQAQSMIAHEEPTEHWAYPVYHSDTGAKQSIDLLLKGEYKITWTGSLTSELGRLAQEIGKCWHIDKKIEGINTRVFVKRNRIPSNTKITYANFVSDVRAQKKETHRIRLTVGDDHLEYYTDPSAPVVGLFDAKIYLNSTISDAKWGARYFVADIENYYLNNKLLQFQYMRIHGNYLAEEFRKEYNVDTLVEKYG